MKHVAGVILIAAVLSGAAAPRASAQGTVDSATVDRILAVVGSKAILASQVQEEIYGRVSKREERLPDAAKDPAAFDKAMKALMHRYVDTLVAFELLHREAVTDTSIKVTDQEVADAADQLISYARKQVKSPEEFKAQLKEMGFATEEDWRKFLLENQRRTMLVRRYEQSLRDDNKIKDRTPTAKEVRAFYDADPTFFGQQPAMVSFKQIVVAPKPTDAARARAKALADSLVIELRKGANFAATAKAFSMDEASRADGGNLDWFPRGKMIREFEDAAFALKPGTISEPVESPFGFHIIQVQRVQPGEVQASHILIIPDIDSAGAQAAHDRAIAVVAAFQKGASFDSLQHLYHDRGEELEITYQTDSIAATPYGPAITNVDSGKVSQPFLLPVVGHPLHSKWAVVQILRRTPAGVVPFEDAKPWIRKTLATRLGEQDYINKLRVRTFVDIREP